MRKYFDKELMQLNKDLVKMSRLCEKALENMITSFKNHDIVLAEEIIKNDRIINDFERRIETLCFHLLLTQQPIASDLRHITSVLKAVTDLERIGDQCADIAEIMLQSQYTNQFNQIDKLYIMLKTVKIMVGDSIEAFVYHDLSKAKRVLSNEQKVNQYFEDIKLLVKEHIDHYIDLLMIAKHLEKIGDHAVNVCEWLEFEEKGSL